MEYVRENTWVRTERVREIAHTNIKQPYTKVRGYTWAGRTQRVHGRANTHTKQPSMIMEATVPAQSKTDSSNIALCTTQLISLAYTVTATLGR